MKRTTKRILFACGTTLGLCLAILAGAVLSPSFLYARKTQFENIAIHHTQPLPTGINSVLTQSLELVKTSELYESGVSINLCLNDGSNYPKLIERLKGQGWAYTVSNNISLNCAADFSENIARWNLEKYQGQNRQWRLTELLAHEMVHAYQANRDFWSAEKHPFWKIEGYAEYIARKNRLSLHERIDLLNQADRDGLNGWDMLYFPDGTGILYNYLNFSALVGYVVEVKGLTYEELLTLEIPFDVLKQEMITWNNRHKS